MKGFLDGLPIFFADQDGVAPLAGNREWFRIIIDLVNKLIEVCTSVCGRYCCHTPNRTL